jgi:hypothetical protein
VKSSIAVVTLGGICAALAACGGSPPPPTPSAAKPPAAATAPTTPVPVASVRPGQPGQPGQAAQAGGQLVPSAPTVQAPEVPKYENKGRKDPFTEVQIATVSGGLAVSTTKLTGIVRGSRSVLALLETQEGIGYILKPGDTLGDGRLMEIGADNVVFAVGPKAGAPAQRVVLRLAAN